MVLEELGIEATLAFVRKATERNTKDKLLKRLRQFDEFRALTWNQRRRFKKLLNLPEVMAAMLDQQPGSPILSALIALKVYNEPASSKSSALADFLVAEIAGCLPTDEARTFNAYRQRAIEQRIVGVGFQVEEVADDLREVGGGVQAANVTLAEIRSLLMARQDAPHISPEVLLKGPLKALRLEAEYAAVVEIEGTDPKAAAARLTNLIRQIAESGHASQTAPFVRQRAQLLTRAQDRSAADEWLPIVIDALEAGPASALNEPLEAWRSLVDIPIAPSWLRSRLAVVEALGNWLLGDVESAVVLDLAIESETEGDPAAARWIMHAVESCLCDGQQSAIIGRQSRIANAADGSDDISVGVRLTLALADATGDEEIWNLLLGEAALGEGRYEPSLSALIQARRARSLFWAGDLDGALGRYRLAYENGARASNWDDAADWASAAIYVMNAQDSFLLADLQTLRDRESAFRDADGGSLLRDSFDNLHLSALAHLMEFQSSGRFPRTARRALREYQRNSIVLGVVQHEITSHSLTGRLWMQLDDPDTAVGHFIRAADNKQAASAAAKLNHFHDCLEDVSAGLQEVRAVALRVAAEESDLIPDDQVAQWATVALGEVRARGETRRGPDTYENAFRLLEGIAARLTDDLVGQLLEEVRKLLPRNAYTGTRVDDQIAQILINLGLSHTDRQSELADCIATAFEVADDVAVEIANYAGAFPDLVGLVRDRLLGVLETSPPERIMQQMNITFALVVIGDQSPTLIESANRFVDRALNRPLAYGPGSVSRIAWVEEPAVMARCLPVERRIELANDYRRRALDANDIDANRASFAVSFMNLGPHLPDEVRDSIFDDLYPLANSPQASTNPFDVMQQRFRNPLGRLRINESAGKLKRYALRSLAVLATTEERQQMVWRTAQKLLVSGERQDSVTVARVGYELSQRGFAPELPWAAMAYSADRQMRTLAAELISYLPTVDIEGVESLAEDSSASVRHELATALRKAIDGAGALAGQQQQVGSLVDRLREDASYRVRSALPVD